MEQVKTISLCIFAILVFVVPEVVPAQDKDEKGSPEAVSEPSQPGAEQKTDGFSLPEVTVEEQQQVAEDEFVDEEATSATKTDTPLIEIPQSISIVTEEQIKQQQAQTLSEALRYTPGFFAAYESDVRFDNAPIVRGFIPTLYLDGLLLPDSRGFGAPRIEPYGLERIEVLKGPSSGLYGQVPPGGLIDMVSKRPKPYAIHEVVLQYGSYDRYQGAFDLGGRVDDGGRILYRLTGLLRKSDTQTKYAEDNRIFLAPSVTVRPFENTSITISAYFQKDDNKGISPQTLPAQGTLFSNPNGKVPVGRYVGEPGYDRVDKTTFFVGYNLEHTFNEIFAFRQNLRYSTVNLDVHDAVRGEGLQPDLRTLNRAVYDITDFADNFQVDNQGLAVFDAGPVRNEVLVGFDYLWTKNKFSMDFGFAPPIDLYNPVYGQPFDTPAPLQDTLQKQNQFGIYAQDQIFFKGFVLTLTGRQDWVDTSSRDLLSDTKSTQDDSAFSYRAGLNYVFDFGVAPYIAYSRSFQPTLGTYFNGKPFKPTRGEQYEAGIKYQPEWFPGIVTAAVYNLEQKNALTADPVNEFFQVQTGKVRVRGFELDATLSPLPGLNMVGGYAYTDSEILKSNIPGEVGNEMSNVPKNQASWWTDYTLQTSVLKGFGLGAGVRYVGDFFGNTDNAIKMPAVTLVDAAAYYDFGGLCQRFEGLKLAVNAANLLDKTYVTCFNENYCSYGNKLNVFGTLSYNW